MGSKFSKIGDFLIYIFGTIFFTVYGQLILKWRIANVGTLPTELIDKVFFYLCMEEHQMWLKTFGFEYSTNNDFEQAMLGAYAKKLGMEYLV